jgi:hypothetical protein
MKVELMETVCFNLLVKVNTGNQVFENRKATIGSHLCACVALPLVIVAIMNRLVLFESDHVYDWQCGHGNVLDELAEGPRRDPCTSLVHFEAKSVGFRRGWAWVVAALAGDDGC